MSLKLPFWVESYNYPFFSSICSNWWIEDLFFKNDYLQKNNFNVKQLFARKFDLVFEKLSKRC